MEHFPGLSGQELSRTVIIKGAVLVQSLEYKGYSIRGEIPWRAIVLLIFSVPHRTEEVSRDRVQRSYR